MEEIKAYIESGILELYILGDLSDQEAREVEAMAAAYPEIKQELESIELAMEQYAMEHAVIPGDNIEKKILSSLQPQVTDVNPSVNHERVVPLHPPVSDSRLRTLRFALAACLGLLVVSVVALYSAHDRLSNAKEQIAELSLQNQKFAARVNYMKESNEELKFIAAMVDDPNWQVVKLSGTPAAPDAKMMVYWNKKNRDVMVDNSKISLPEHDESHQYQLWAMVAGKPVDLGVFDLTPDSVQLLQKMKEISSAQAFAVTLEKRGGSPTPTMEKMVVLGGI